MLRAPSACPAHVCAEERSPLHAPHRTALLASTSPSVMLHRAVSCCQVRKRRHLAAVPSDIFEISGEMNYRTPPRSTRKTTFSQSEDRDMKWRRDCRKKDCRHQTKSHRGLHPDTGFFAGRWLETVSPCRRPDTVSASAGATKLPIEFLLLLLLRRLMPLPLPSLHASLKPQAPSSCCHSIRQATTHAVTVPTRNSR